MTESLLIIGAGMSGLAAGIYAQMNGYASRIVEAQAYPGGVCTGWRRGEFTFAPNIRWIVGTSPSSPIYSMWEELGVLRGTTIRDVRELLAVEGRDGRTLHVFTDLSALENELIEQSPQDADHVREFVRGVRGLTGLCFPPLKAPEIQNAIDRTRGGLRRLAHAGQWQRWSATTVAEFVDDFHDPFLREALGAAFGPPDGPILAVMTTLARMHLRACGRPGGAPQLSEGLAARYLELGGTIDYECPVEKILVENGRAVGIRLMDGTQRRASAVISSVDGHTTLFALLRGAFVDDRLSSLYEKLRPFSALLSVSLGLGHPVAELTAPPCGVSIPLSEPLAVDGRRLHRLTFEASPADSGLAPAGKGVVHVVLEASYEHWRKLREDPEAYESEKRHAAEQVARAIDHRFPGTAAAIEAIDVATPVTWQERTGNWQGSPRGWLPATDMRPLYLPRVLDLGGFVMIGHWTAPGGGLTAAALSGRHAIQMLCRADRRRFSVAPSPWNDEGTTREELHTGAVDLRTTANRLDADATAGLNTRKGKP